MATREGVVGLGVATEVGVTRCEAVATGLGVASGKNVDLETLAAGWPGPEPVAGVALVALQADSTIRLAKIKNLAKIMFFDVIEGFGATFIPVPRLTPVCNQGMAWL